MTGATGYIGRCLTRRLVSLGREVHVVTRRRAARQGDSRLGARVTAHFHDGSTDGMRAILSASRPSLVYHMASYFAAEHSPSDVEPLLQSNVLFGTQLLEAMGEVGCPYLVNASTSWQHHEGEAYRPVCLYAATKQAFEDILRYYVDAAALAAVSLRLFDTYGPADPRPKLMPLLVRAAAEGDTLFMSPGEQLLDLVHVDDVVNAFVVAGEHLQAGRFQGHNVFTVSSGRAIRLRDLVELFCRVTGRDLKVSWGARPYRRREVMVPWNGGTPLPGWQPRVSLEEGLRSVLSTAA